MVLSMNDKRFAGNLQHQLLGIVQGGSEWPQPLLIQSDFVNPDMMIQLPVARDERRDIKKSGLVESGLTRSACT